MQKYSLRRDFPKENGDNKLPGGIYKKQENNQREKELERELEELIEKSNNVLFRCTTQFPFDLFPDKVIIDEIKITIEHGSFFRTFDIDTISLEDIEDVTVSSAIFLSRIDISLKNGKEPVVIKNLKNEDAMKAKRILWGIILANEKNIDISKLETKDLINKLEELGKEK